MKVLVACEKSSRVAKAFRDRGHDAWSCDLEPSEINFPYHIQDDCLKHLGDGWDMMIAHPPCTYLSYAGIRWWNDEDRVYKRLEALRFFADLWTAPIKNICIENPRGCASPTIAKYTQEIQPWYFGDEFNKPTWLWLKGLPKLIHVKKTDMFDLATHVSKGEMVTHITKKGKLKTDSAWYYNVVSLDSIERQELRSRTFLGIADAMANQWGSLSILGE